MFNPFTGDGAGEERAMLERARAGEASAFEALVRLHQPWIFNIVLRMVSNWHEAEDLTQDILLRSFTRLSSFRGQSRFRTWLYRIAVNRVLRMRETGQERYQRKYGRLWADDRHMEAYLDQAAPAPAHLAADLTVIAWEVRVKCLLGMLLCLGRRMRLAFVLGAVLEVDSRTASGVMGTSAAAFRQLLSRARRRLWNFLNERCGLVNPEKPCTCERSVAANLANGYVDPLRLVFGGRDAPRIRNLLGRAGERLDRVREDGGARLYRDQPFHTPPDFAARVRAVVEGGDCRAFLDTEPSP